MQLHILILINLYYNLNQFLLMFIIIKGTSYSIHHEISRTHLIILLPTTHFSTNIHRKKVYIFGGWNNFISHMLQTKAINNGKWVYQQTSENSKTANKMKF